MTQTVHADPAIRLTPRTAHDKLVRVDGLSTADAHARLTT
ncbi:hypothetical protein DSM104299_01129 [Baekduia alba]|nr:hypothetical protein DSM104299_01129 [Baekduia alba]